MTPLIGMGQDRLTSFEPAYVDELAVLLRWSFDHMQLPAPGGGSVYLRLSTRSIAQPQRQLGPSECADITAGAYWVRRPGPNAEVVIAYAGVVAPEAVEAVGLVAQDRRDVGLLAITSADLLHEGWHAAQRAREDGQEDVQSHVEALLSGLPRHCGLVTVLDGHPTTLSWLGSVRGHRTHALGVTRFGQTGTIAELYRAAGIDVQAIIAASQAVAPGRPMRYLRAS